MMHLDKKKKTQNNTLDRQHFTEFVDGNITSVMRNWYVRLGSVRGSVVHHF